MKLENFVKQITDILDDNNVQYHYKNVGHVQPIENDLAILYFTKDIMIFLNEYKCMVDISFCYTDETVYLKEMTIQVDEEEYGYKHCKIFDRKTNKYHEFPLNTKLDEESLRYIQDYISILLRYVNDEESLHNIWKKSLTRTSYKEKYPIFHIDKTLYIDKEKYQSLEDRFGTWERLNERLFFFEDNEVEFRLVENED